MDAPALLLQGHNFRDWQVRFVLADVQVVEEFFQRTARVQNKSYLIRVMKTSVPFSDIVRQ